MATKPIKHNTETWQEIRVLSNDLARERGLKKMSLADTVAEAVKFFKENRGKV